MVETASKSISIAPACVDFEEYMNSDGERIIWSVINLYGRTLDWEEAHQELSIALWKALCAYDPNKSVKISTLVYQSVLNRLRMMLRASRTQKRFKEQTGRVDEKGFGELTDETVDIEADIEQAEILESRANALHWAIRNSNLKEKERFVIIETLKETPQKEIGKMLGKGQSQISRLKMSAMKKIKETMLAAQWDGESIWDPDLTGSIP